MDKLDLLLNMIEHPENYTEQEVHELLSDDDVRKHYEVMVLLREAFAKETGESILPESSKIQMAEPRNTRMIVLNTSLRKIAAMFIAAVLISGLAYAAYRVLSPIKTPQLTEATTPSLTGKAGGGSSMSDSIVRFPDTRLDSILTIVCSYYGRELCFVDTTLREMRLFTSWNRNGSLAEYIGTLNVFDGLHLTDERDTVFVDSVDGEEE